MPTRTSPDDAGVCCPRRGTVLYKYGVPIFQGKSHDDVPATVTVSGGQRENLGLHL